MLAAVLFDRGRQERKTIELVKAAAVRQVIRLNDSSSLVLGERRTRNAKMLRRYARGQNPLRFDDACFRHRNH